MLNDIVKYFTENKLAIEFDSIEMHDILCGIFGLPTTCSPSFGVVSFYKLKCGGIYSTYRFGPFIDAYWDWQGYDIVSADEFLYLIDENTSILQHAI